MKRRVSIDGKEIVLVGTAHVSEESAEEVNSVIEEEEPDTVAVELDQDRYESLRDEKGWEEKNVAEAIEDGNGALLFLNVILSIYQRKLGEDLEVAPGSDMLAAVQAAEGSGKEVSLIDRDISKTFRSARDSLSVWEKAKLSTEFFASFFSSVDVEKEEIEELKEKDAITALVEELGEHYPGIKRAFLDERNAYMAERLRELEAEKIVAVVGAAHIEGIEKELEEPSKVAERRRKGKIGGHLKKAVEYGVPALIIGMLAYIFLFIGFETGSRAFAVWFLLNGTLAATGALLSRSHFLTAIVSFVAAPFTSINPALPSGLVAAYAENRFRPPTVGDLESVGEVKHIRELWTNSALRLLLIFMLVNLGSSIASYIGAGYLAQIIV
ncbi:MAG: TraB/GumN family protein [Candidatus Nanohaloarchaeota archaeon QJJ-7]|nr:TraB/GumN family protein [Candidatus Nanohaloarchaeota archaeon QJJ-7]